MTIDWWTLGLQTVNVLDPRLASARFFWRPLAAMIEQRRARGRPHARRGRAKRAEAAAAAAEAVKARAGFAAEREAILAAARDGRRSGERDAPQHEADRPGGAKSRRRRRAAMAARASGAPSALSPTGRAVSRLEIAGRLAGRLDAGAVRAAFLDGLSCGDSRPCRTKKARRRRLRRGPRNRQRRAPAGRADECAAASSPRRSARRRQSALPSMRR